MTRLRVRDVSLEVEVIGHGYPLLLMHGGPGADHHSMLPFRRLADRFTLVFYDHRCNGRSVGAPVTSMTWENLTADADALRERLGFEHWAVVGHSFGGHVALEYALRYPGSLSHLVLLDTGGDARWSRENGPDLLAGRGYSPKTVALARRFFRGQIRPNEMRLGLMRFGSAYYHRPGIRLVARELIAARGTRMRPDALIFAGRHLLDGWSVMDRLGEIVAPTLVLAGRDDFLFPPEHQVELAAGIPGARLRIVERAGHNAHSERPAEIMDAVRGFLRDEVVVAPAAVSPVAMGPPAAKRHPAARVQDIYVAESGDPESPAVVFIHGGGPSGLMWRRHLDQLAPTFHCLAPDLPGFGRSNRLASISLAETADLVAELIETRVRTGRAHVVGLSYGGSVVLALLDRHPDRIDRAVVDGSGVLSSWIDPLVLLGAAVVSPIAGTRPVATLLGPIGLRGLGIALRGASPAAMRRAFREGYTAPLTRRQLEANCPTLFVAGEKERIVRASNAAFAALMPHAVACFVPGLRHAWFAWRPELHMRMVEAWLSGQALPSGLEPEPRSPEAVDRVLRLLARPARLGSAQPQDLLA
jgi:proline iminopeptidase